MTRRQPIPKLLALLAMMTMLAVVGREVIAQVPNLANVGSTSYSGCYTLTYYARSLMFLPDLDGDGGSEIAIGIPRVMGPCITSTLDYSGRIEVRSSQGLGLLYVVTGVPGSTQSLGVQMARMDDIDGDGLGDFCTTTGASGSIPFELQARSSATGSVIYAIAYPTVINLPIIVAKMGDVDGDSVSDLAVLLPGMTASGTYPYTSRFEIRSGATGSLLSIGFPPPGNIGFRIEGLGDVSGDGLCDLILSTATAPGGSGVTVYAYAANLMQILYTLNTTTNPPLPDSDDFAAVGDVNDDGIGDFVAGRSYFSTSSPALPLQIRSGATGQIVRSLQPPPGTANSAFGGPFASVGDVDGDGYTDIAVAAPWYQFSAPTGPTGAVFVYSGASGVLLYQLTGPQPFNPWSFVGYPTIIAGRGDVNNDGFADIALGDDNGSIGTDSVFVFAGAPVFDRVAATGTVTNGFGAPVDVLFGEVIGGTSGPLAGGVGRTLTTVPGAQLAFWMAMPVGHTGVLANHVLFGRFIDGADFGTTTLPFGLGTMAFAPSLLGTSDPSFFFLSSSYDGSGALPSLPAFSTGLGNPAVATPPIPVPMSFWIQGLVEDDSRLGVPLSVTNLVRIVAR